MGLTSFSWFLLLFLLLTFLHFKAHCEASSDISATFSVAPLKISRLSSATFEFQVFLGRDVCRNCSITCKLDDQISSDCKARRVSYSGLHDGDHTLKIYTNGLQGAGCASYNWTVDTIPPTAYVKVASPFTNALNFSVDISFSELCSGGGGGGGGGGFRCTSANECNLLVYGPGRVLASTLTVLEPDLKFSLLVGISSSVQYGRVILVMDKSFCTDSAGNSFSRTPNSTFILHFDRRSVFANLRTHIQEKLLHLNKETRTVEATNNQKNLKVYLYFSEPVLNSSIEILNSLHTSEGLLHPNNRKTNGNRRFGFLVKKISNIAIVTITFNSSSIISRQGTPVSPIAPVTFLYDSERPSVRLSTTSNMRTREHSIPILIKFVKPVFGFNSSTLSLYGGNLQSFHEVSRSMYIVDIHAHGSIVSVNVPENITKDVAGNKNLASNILQVRHYSVPVISAVLSTFTTAAFAVTSLAAGLLTISTASLQSLGVSSRPSSLTNHPARNLFRMACYIQVIALSRWLEVPLPVEYYEFARGLQWSIPYLSLPWENGKIQSVTVEPSPFSMGLQKMHKGLESGTIKSKQLGDKKLGMDISLFGLPLTPMEYQSFFESHDIKAEAEYVVDRQNSKGWEEFKRNMFWLAVIGGILIFLHALLLSILRCRSRNSEGRHSYGVLVLPRFEIFLIILALPCVCQASVALIRGGRTSGVIVGILLLGVTFIFLLALLTFLSVGITLGRLLQYKEVHQEGQEIHWYQDIVRVTLGPGKRGQWTWKNQPDSVHLKRLGPLFEDLRGPPKYMLSQISGGNNSKLVDRIIASDDETDDAEAPFIQKLFGVLRIYYTELESVKRVVLGVVAGFYMDIGLSRTPSLIMLCVTSFQLFFLVLKKPFIKRKVQLVEILSASSEVGIFGICIVLAENKFSDEVETRIGMFMLFLFLISFTARMINEWYALYSQTLLLDSTEGTLSSGLATVFFGLVLILIPWNLPSTLDENILSKYPRDRDAGETSSSDQYISSVSRGSATTDKPWLKQLGEMARNNFRKDETRAQQDPSSSRIQKSGGWSGHRSESSSVTSSSSDFKSKSRALYRDLEAIFSSK